MILLLPVMHPAITDKLYPVVYWATVNYYFITYLSYKRIFVRKTARCTDLSCFLQKYLGINEIAKKYLEELPIGSLQ